MAQIDQFLKAAVVQRASDLHLSSGVPARMRIDGDLMRLEMPPLDSESLEHLIFEILTEQERERFLSAKNLDKSYALSGVGNFRVNVFQTRKGIAAVFRTIPTNIPTLESLGLPPAIADFTELPKGLVLVTGPTGSGKSTTLAAMIDLINRKQKYHILTVEDPVEFVHESKESLLNQREIGSQCHTFADALKYALREDPDVILVGEMRDLETISLALTAAETGHLVFGTLHTRGAGASVDRIIDSFPANQQAMIRTMLSESLAGVISQALLKRADGKGRIAALEILVVTHAIANLIREGKTFQIPSIMQTGRKDGMILMDQHILELVDKRLVSPEEAEPYLEDPGALASRKGKPAPTRPTLALPPKSPAGPSTSALKFSLAPPVAPSREPQRSSPSPGVAPTLASAMSMATPLMTAKIIPAATSGTPPKSSSVQIPPNAPKSPPRPPPLRPGSTLSVAKAAPPPIVTDLTQENLAGGPGEVLDANAIALDESEGNLLNIDMLGGGSDEGEGTHVSLGGASDLGEDLELLVPESAFETRIEEKEQTATVDLPPLHDSLSKKLSTPTSTVTKDTSSSISNVRAFPVDKTGKSVLPKPPTSFTQKKKVS